MDTDHTFVVEAAEQVFAFRDDPLGAIAAANRKKRIDDQPVIRSAAELQESVARAPLSESIALAKLADRLDAVNHGMIRKSMRALDSGYDTRLECHPIGRVGIYIPERLPASAYTYLSAARAAGVKEIVVYLAQNQQGLLDPLSVQAAVRYGAAVWGGPARFGFPALAFGISGIGACGCHLVCGPCGKRLNYIKQLACIAAGVAADMSAGPSTLSIVADESADWNQVTLDLVSQLEHGPDSRADLILVGDSTKAAWQASGNQHIIEGKSAVRIEVASDLNHAIDLVNEIGPETAEIWLTSGDQVASAVTACGVVYIRRASSLGDYGAIGRGCADPTDGLAKAQSGLSPMTFLRWQAVVREQSTDIELQRAASLLAQYERLPAHSAAING